MLAIIKLIANAFTTISPEQWLFTGIGLIAILVIVVQIINVTGPLLEEGLLIGIGVFVIIFVVAIIWMGIDWLYDMVNNFFHGFDRW